MSVSIEVAPRKTTVEKVVHRFNYEAENHDFILVTSGGERCFHWLCEPSSLERESSEQALSRLCELLGIPFEYEEVSEDEHP